MTDGHKLNRRKFCLCCLAAGAVSLRAGDARAGLGGKGIVEAIIAESGKATIHVHRLRGGVSVLEGSGGNMAVSSGPEGKLLVDAGIAVSKPQIATALELLGPEPVTQLVNTHWHFDHSNGNTWLHEAGAAITAHENTRTRLLTAQRVEDWDYDFLAPAPGALPTTVFADRHAIRHNGMTLELAHYRPAHTDSDISVRFREADILHTGDTFWNGVYPMIDYSTGGHIDGAIEAAELNLALTTDATIVIPGHGRPVSNRAELQAFRDMLVGIRANVAKAKRGGVSLEAVQATRPTREWDAHWGNFVISPDLFTQLVFEGV